MLALGGGGDLRRTRALPLALGLGGLAELLEVDHFAAGSPVALGDIPDQRPDAPARPGIPAGGVEHQLRGLLDQPGLPLLAERALRHADLDYSMWVGDPIGRLHGRG